MSVLELSDILKARALKEINEDPSRVQDDLAHIKEWLKKQPHIHARTDDQWLLAFLRGCKFSLERTKEKLDTFYTMRTLAPELLGNRDTCDEDTRSVIKHGIILNLSNYASDDQPRVIFARHGACDPQKLTPQTIFKTNMMLREISLLEDPAALINGIVLIQDLADVTLAHMAPPATMKKGMKILQEAYPDRVREIHFFNTPGFFETLFGFLKPFLTEKMKSRISVHGDNLEELYKLVPKEILPIEYGGTGDSIQTIIDQTLEKFDKYHDWFKEDAQYKTDESKRPGKPKTFDEMFGIEGSFRKLEVD